MLQAPQRGSCCLGHSPRCRGRTGLKGKEASAKPCSGRTQLPRERKGESGQEIGGRGFYNGFELQRELFIYLFIYLRCFQLNVFLFYFPCYSVLRLFSNPLHSFFFFLHKQKLFSPSERYCGRYFAFSAFSFLLFLKFNFKIIK